VTQWLNNLQESGYRLTGPRRAVVQIMAQSEFILDPNQIYAEARRLYPHIGLVSVYRTLEKLEELGLVTRVHEINGCHGYVSARSATSTCLFAVPVIALNTFAEKTSNH
jgi:Fur family transcriptional regulator, ferric uptake regulator